MPVVFLCVSALLILGVAIIRKLTDERLQNYGDLSRNPGPRSTSLINNAVRGFLEVITFRAVNGVRKGTIRHASCFGLGATPLS